MLFEINASEFTEVRETTFEEVGLRERGDLQRLLRDQIEIISPDTIVLDEEFSNWEDSSRRIDLLGLHKDGSLVVIEIKRTQDGGHAELQAIRYASMISSMTFQQGVDTLSRYLSRRGQSDDAESRIREHMENPELTEETFARSVSILLVSADFSRELTTSVLWLRDFRVDIRCVQLKPYVRHSGEVLVDIRQLIPLPEATEFQTGVAIKRTLERSERTQHLEMPSYRERYHRFWTAFLERAIPEIRWLDGAEPSFAFWQTQTPCPFGFDIKHDSYQVSWTSRGVKADWETIQANRERITAALGTDLLWRDGRRPRVAKEVPFADALRNEAQWPALHHSMIESMHGFMAVFGSIGITPSRDDEE